MEGQDHYYLKFCFLGFIQQPLIHTPAEREWKLRSQNVGAGLGSSQCPLVGLWLYQEEGKAPCAT